MITGKVPDRQEAIIDLEVVGRNQKEELVDMSLVYGNRVTLTVLDGGDVIIAPLQ